MAHLIDNSKGFNAFVAYQMPAWHGLGEIFTEKLTTIQALERGGLDYTVLKLPNVHLLPNGDELISEDSFFTVRTDVNKVLGSRLGKDYEVLQNVEALNVVDEILQSGRATIETAGAINEGRKAFICLKVDRDIIVDGSDTVKQYVLIATSHDGSMAITATPTNVRVVCNNTLTAALRGANGAIKIRHTSNAASRLQEAAKVLNLIARNTEVNTENYNKMKGIAITKADLMNYFGNIFCTESEIKDLQMGKAFNQALSTRKQNILSDVASYAVNGKGQFEALNGKDGLNMWYAFNAVTGYVTRKKYSSVDDRANSMLFGSAASTIQEAGILALEPAKIQPLHKINLSGMNFN
jgi:phage/plasmid-like protein (TIGR03299 family)